MLKGSITFLVGAAVALAAIGFWLGLMWVLLRVLPVGGGTDNDRAGAAMFISTVTCLSGWYAVVTRS